MSLAVPSAGARASLSGTFGPRPASFHHSNRETRDGASGSMRISPPSAAENPPVRENLFWMHAVRIWAAFGVIVLHVAADVITEWQKVPDSWWWTAHGYNSVARGCVGLFVMVSGALLLPGNESIGVFFRKRWNRVAIPFIAWSFLYLLWRKEFYQPGMGWTEALQKIAAGNIHFHLWFIYSLVGLYLITPLFRILIRHAKPKEIFYFLGIWFIVASLLPTAEHLLRILTPLKLHIKTIAEPAQGLIGFFVLGYAVRKYGEPRHLPFAWIVWLISLGFCIGGTFFMVQKTGHFQSVFYESLAPNVVLYAVSLFIIFKILGQNSESKLSPGAQNLLLKLSKSTLGIYLIHPMILDALIKGRWGITLKANMGHPIYMIPLTALATYLLSLAAVQIIQRIPSLKRIV